MFIQTKLCVDKLVFTIILALISLRCLCTAEHNGFTFQYLENSHRLLKLECDGSVFVPEGVITYITIYNGTSKRTLAEVKVGYCPTVRESPTSKNIYTLACTQDKREVVSALKIIITDWKTSLPQIFGCNVSSLGKSGDVTLTTWTINVHKKDLELRSSERAGESQQKAIETSVSFAGSSFAMYVMGVVILSLALGLLSALCYIGMRSFKTRINSDSESARRGSSRPNDETDLQNETGSVSDNGPDGGCERNLVCPNSAFRRPSHQEHSEPMSPSSLIFSDYVGFDFTQAQLSDKLIAPFSLTFSRKKSTKKTYESTTLQYELDSRSHVLLDMEANMNGEVQEGRNLCSLNNSVLLEYMVPLQREFHEDIDFSQRRIYKNMNWNVNREVIPQRGCGLAGR